MTAALIAPAAGAEELSAVVGALARLIDRIADAGFVARGLSDAVDWQAHAARTFHERATAWAGEVSGLVCMAETVRLDVARARDRALIVAAFPGLDRLGLHQLGFHDVGAAREGW